MKNPVAKYAYKFNKSYAHKDKTKYDRVKERCTHWDLDYLSNEEIQKLAEENKKSTD
tara:strand:+ start:8681 stop:8851 length:171 start_codon:yes stop_codon:yes gene_type:complete